MIVVISAARLISDIKTPYRIGTKSILYCKHLAHVIGFVHGVTVGEQRCAARGTAKTPKSMYWILQAVPFAIE